MLVPADDHDEAVAIAKRVAGSVIVGDPADPQTTIGPVVSQLQYDRIQELIAQAIDEGTELVYGGTGSPDGLERGYFVKPTIFANVDNGSTIAQQEVFGPVLSIIPYNNVEHAIQIANESLYGLCGYVWGEQLSALNVAKRVRTGMMLLKW